MIILKISPKNMCYQKIKEFLKFSPKSPQKEAFTLIILMQVKTRPSKLLSKYLFINYLKKGPLSTKLLLTHYYF